MKNRPLPTLLLALASLATLGAATPKASSVYDFEAKRINGATTAPKDAASTKLSEFRGKVLLIVNTASQCGYTKQYKGLEALYEKYAKEGFVILGFPSNDFGAQEPGSDEEIKNFCERNFKVSFPMFTKAPVSGNRIQPLYAYLVENAPWKGAVGWNFEKFLIARDGKIAGRYKSAVTPEDAELDAAIRKNLGVKSKAEN